MYKRSGFFKNIADAGASIGKTIQQNDVAKNIAVASVLGTAGLGGLGYGAYKAFKTPSKEEQAKIDKDTKLSAKEKKKAKQSWVKRNPWLAAGIGTGLGAAALAGASKFNDWKNSAEGMEAWQGMKDDLADNGLEDNPIAKKLGLRLADFRPDRVDTSIFGKDHKPGEFSRATWETIKRKGKHTMTDMEILKEKTGMSDEDAKKYLDNVRGVRRDTELQNSLMGTSRVSPAEKTTIYTNENDIAKITGDNPMELRSMGPFSMPDKFEESDDGKTLRLTHSLIYMPESADRNDALKGLRGDLAMNKLNGFYNKNVKGRNIGKLEGVLGTLAHESSHSTNTSVPKDGNTARWRSAKSGTGTLKAVPRTGVFASIAGGMNTGAMNDVQDAFLNGRPGQADLTYPLYGVAEATQVLNTMKQQAIALNGGKVPKTQRGWRKAFEHLAMTDPTTQEQFRFQSYITPQDLGQAAALEGRKRTLNNLLDALYRTDNAGMDRMSQLGIVAGGK